MGKLTMAKKKIAITGIVVGAVLLFAYNVNWISYIGQPVSTHQDLSSKENQAKLLDISLSDERELIEFFDANPRLLKRLSDDIQKKRLNSEFSESDLQKLSSLISALHNLLVAAGNGVEHEQLDGFEKEKGKLTNYLTAYTSLKRKQGKGVLSYYDSVAQTSLSVATKLLLELQEGQSLAATLSQLAQWYALESETQSKIRIFELSLLHYAWRFSADNLMLKLEGFEIETYLKRSADLIRLLTHENQSVATNAAALVGYFSPDNAITALRFQLARSNDRQFSFLLLDALKSYGQYRNQFEPQLNKMLRMTSDTDLQHKIMETVDYLHGRPSELLSKGSQTK